MALIGKIRKNFWFVLILLGLALAAFVIMDVSSASGLGGGATNLDMGEVNGQKINYRDFQRTEQVYFGNQGDAFQTRDNVWNYYVERAIIDDESDDLGINVSKDELMDLQFGSNMSPIMMQNWRNPQTGALDRNQLNQYKSAIENNEELDPRFRDFWAEQELQIIKAKKQEKLNTLVSKSIYTPTWLAQTAYQESNGKVDFDYVKIPFDQIGDDQVSLTDDDYSSYINSNKAQYTNDVETRTLEYAIFDVNATEEDKAAIRSQMTTLKEDFRGTTDDSLFAFSNEGFYNDFYFSKDQLAQQTTDSIASILPNLGVGDVAGPFEEQNVYRVLKLIDKQVIPDSVRASHILIPAERTNTLAVTKARGTIDSLRNLIERGVERFDSLAVKFSQDGSSADGGDLGYFAQDRMVPEFKAACFYYGKEGNLYTVQSQFGFHLIKVVDQKYLDREPKYKFAFINKPIIPSTDTQDKINEDVADLLAAHPYLDDMVSVINERGDATFDRISNVKPNDHVINGLGTGNTTREIVRWAFNGATSVNDIAPDVFSYTEPNLFYTNRFVIVGLKSIEPKGLRSVASLKDEITPLIQNKKKAEIITSAISGKDLAAAAAAYGLSTESAAGVANNASFIPNLGNEPKVMAALANTAVNSTSAPITGNAGVYLVTPTNKMDAGQPTNLPAFRSTNANSERVKVAQGLIESLKKGADVDDKRFTFF